MHVNLDILIALFAKLQYGGLLGRAEHVPFLETSLDLEELEAATEASVRAAASF